MRILQKKSNDTLQYLKYDGWCKYKQNSPIDLTNCILFTEAEAKLNPPLMGETYQHYGCYLPIEETK